MASQSSFLVRTRGARVTLAYAVAIAVVALLYEKGDDAVDLLVTQAEERVGNWDRLEAAMITSGTGLEMMQRDVVEAVELLKRHNATDFRMSTAFANEGGGFYRQRVDEIGWPIPYAADSKFVLRLRREDPACNPLGLATEVALDRCD